MITSRKILLVEDELTLGNIIKDCLENRGFAVTHLTDGRVAHETYFLERFDLIVLDVGLPSESGLSIAKGIRVADKLTPIIFLTALSMPEDVLNGFKAGGNDYLKKPFDIEELIIRIEVLLNQNRLFEHEGLKTNPDQVSIGQFTFDTKKNLLSHPEVVWKLTAREADILSI
ncbi:MAG: response regulator transcription factor, partial [Pedobacter sp.]